MTDMLTEDELMAKAKSNKVVEKQKEDELKVLFDDPQEFTIAGEKIKIRPFTFGELPKVIALLRGVGGTFAYYKKEGKLNTTEAIMDLVATGGENLIQLMVINVGKSREWFDTIPMDEGIELMIKFVTLNVDFFTKRVAPALDKIQ